MDIDIVFSTILNIAVMVFAAASMLSTGLGHTLRELVGPLRNVLNVFRVLVANFLLVPLLGFLLIWLLDLETGHAIGIFLVSVAAGAPFLIKLTRHAEHDVGMSATLLVLLLPATVLFMPIVVPVALPEAEVSAGAIARPLVLTMMVPLAAGLLFRTFSERWPARLQPILATVSSIALAALIISTTVLHFEGMIGIGLRPVLAAVLLIVGAFLSGYAMSGLGKEERGVLGLATAQRNVAAATVVATQSVNVAVTPTESIDLADTLTQSVSAPDTLVMVVVTSLVALAVLFPIGTILRRRLARKRARTATAPGAVATAKS